jgi:hypothetical protein
MQISKTYSPKMFILFKFHFFSFLLKIDISFIYILAQALDSLVRVSRRVMKILVKNICKFQILINTIYHEYILLETSTEHHWIAIHHFHQIKLIIQKERQRFIHFKCSIANHGNIYIRHPALPTSFSPFPLINFKFFWLSLQSPFHLSITVLILYRSLLVYLAFDVD